MTRDRLVRDEVGGYVMTVLHQLPLMQPSVVVLRDVHGWAAEEVGAVLEITDADQRALLHRGRSRLRGGLERRLDDWT